MKLTIKDAPKKQIQKDMFGLFFEDINYGLDGGLYGEMLENRGFEFLECRGSFADYTQFPAYRYGWNSYPTNSNLYLDIREDAPLNTVNPHYLRVVAPRAGEGFTNKAYDGIFMKAGVPCRVSFYAKGNAKIQIQILGKDGEILTKSEDMELSGDNWKKYTTEVVSENAIEAGLFTVRFLTNAEVCFDQFSMMPSDAVLGIFRKDLAEALKELEPGFLRFPGGCVVEGSQLTNRYQWKLTVGPVEERKANWNRWAVHENDGKDLRLSPWPYYNQSLGVGFFEYFLLCEYLGCKAVPVLNVGLACQYHSRELVASDSPEFKEYVQDAVDLIEFANGPVSTKWGALRAQMGHPESFGLEYIGIGNEQWETEEVDFFHRYECFEKAIHEKYPEVKCLGSAGPDVGTERYQAAWNHYAPILKERPEYAYAVDEHYYVPDTWLYEHVHMYDDYPRTNKVFAGEYACHIYPEAPMGKRNCFQAALAEAAFMTGLERNADVVLLASYAPLFARIGYTQWQPDMIWFDAKDVYKTPNYYVQQMYSLYTGDELLPVETDEDNEKKGLYVTASKDSKTGKVYVKLIHSGKDEITVDITGIAGKDKKATLITMTGEMKDCNSLEEPTKVAPHKCCVSDVSKISLAGKSISVMVLE